MSATIDGVSWSAAASLSAAAYVAPGAFTISGSNVPQSGTARAISMSLLNVPGPGTYRLGTGANVPGGTAVTVVGSSSWGTPLSGNAGTLVITTLTQSRIAGTFSFVGESVQGGATGELPVTNGAFDMNLLSEGPLGEVPQGQINALTAEFAGGFYSAATVASSGTLAGIFSVASGTTTYSVAMTLREVTGPDVLQLEDGIVSLRVSDMSTDPVTVWSSTVAGSEGAIVVATVSSERVTGTFSGTLELSLGEAKEALVVTNGEFDLGL